MVKVIVGTMGRSPFAKTEAMSTPAQFKAFLGACQSYDVKELDTARVYSGGENERLLGEVDAGKQFQVSTKINITGDGALKRNSILQSADESLASLREQAVDIFYIHRPDRSVPMEETCSAINDLYQQGKFKRFGICSYAAKEVEEMHTLCKAKGYVLPSVYQGNYNPLARRPETELFPTLRRLGIHFYGFGPLAGGLLAKPAQDISVSNKESRFGALPMLGSFYLKDDMVSQVRKLQDLCRSHGVTSMDATLRWLMHHSPLGPDDGVLLGASSIEQVQGNLKATQGGPLSEDLVGAFEDLWKSVEAIAPPYHQ